MPYSSFRSQIQEEMMLKVGFAYSEMEALNALAIEDCNVVLVPSQEESENGNNFDHWCIYCPISRIDSVEDELSQYEDFELVSEDEVAKFSVHNVSISELSVMLGVLESEILRLSYDENLDRYYFSE